MAELPAIIRDNAAPAEAVQSFCKRLISYYGDNALTGQGAVSYIKHIEAYVRKRGVTQERLNKIYVWLLENYSRRFKVAPGISEISEGYQATIGESMKHKVTGEKPEYHENLSNVLSEYLKLRKEGFSDSEIRKQVLGEFSE